MLLHFQVLTGKCSGCWHESQDSLLKDFSPKMTMPPTLLNTGDTDVEIAPSITSMILQRCRIVIASKALVGVDCHSELFTATS